MTKDRAAFIEACVDRAPHSPDGSLLNRAAAYLMDGEDDLYQAFVAEAAARREAERPDLTPQHQAVADQALAAAVAAREVQEQTDGRDGDSAPGGEASAEETRTEAEGTFPTAPV